MSTATYAAGSRGILSRLLLPVALRAAVVPLSRAGSADGVLRWGLKRSGEHASRAAARFGLPLITCEDGFVRSIGLGVAGAEPFGFVADRSGIYYDATRSNDLEAMIVAGPEADARSCRGLIDRIVAEGVSKYNHTWQEPTLPASGRPRVLLIDQTTGDLSVPLGLADDRSFARMIEAALDEHPGAELLIKPHPDVVAGKRRGYLAGRLPAGCRVLSGAANPQRLLTQVEHVYVVTSQFGFEALLAGKTVSCFGMPFYAGWGLTRDDLSHPRRGLARTLEQVFDAAYLRYTRYVDPIRRERCELETILDRIRDHRRVAEANVGRVFCFGFQWWKRPVARRFLGGPRSRVVFARSARLARWRGLEPSDRIVVWGRRDDQAVCDLASANGILIERLEDGFLRSVGLGSDLARPRSLVLDRSGIYFDATRASDLETLLAEGEFSAAELARARALIERLRASGITKYNTGRARALDLSAAGARRKVLVPGQVEDDASILTGCVDIRSNAALLEAARAAEPEAFLVYKPHPDVLAGNRRGVVDARVLARCCDLIVDDVDMSACLRAVDTVHTMTSLAGFEALIRGRQVTTHGLPFYAGWGLTSDRHRCRRRTRTLDLPALVAAVLVLYPRYLDWESGLFCGPEAVIDRLAAARRAGAPEVGIPRWQRWLRKARHAFRGG